MSEAKTERAIEWEKGDGNFDWWKGESTTFKFRIHTDCTGYLLDIWDTSKSGLPVFSDGNFRSEQSAKWFCEEYLRCPLLMEMSETQRSNREFMQGCGQVVRDTPGDPGAEARLSQFKIIFEEVLELVYALNIEVTPTLGGCPADEMRCYSFDVDNCKHHTFNLTEIVDALADIIYTCLGMANACGIAMKPILDEVCENNLLKLNTGTMNAEGKLVKRPDHPKPDIKGLLKNQGWEGE